MKFDLAAKVVGNNQRAFVVHGGRNRRNHPAFIENGIAYLEIPDFGLTHAMLTEKKDLRRAVRRFEAREAFKNRESASTPPPSNILSYSDDPVGSALQPIVGSIQSLFTKAKIGDIVITPGFRRIGDYRQPILHFGEIAKDFSTEDLFRGGTVYNDSVPFRHVKWLNFVDRRAVSPALETKIGRPPAVREIRIDSSTEEIFRLTYDNFIYNDGSTSLISANRYTAEQFNTLNQSSRIIAILVAGFAASEKGEFVQPDDLRDFVAAYLAQSGIENIEVDFASPGHWRIIGASAALAMFVALGVSALTSGMSIEALQIGIEVTNSVSGPSGVDDQIQRSMNIFLNSLGNNHLEQIRAEALEAKELIGLQSAVKVEP